MSASREVTVVERIVSTVRAPDMQTVLRNYLPQDVPLDKFTYATIEALKRRPDLFEDADRQSLYNAIAEAARDGLIPDGKQGALVPFNTKVGDKYVKKVQWMLMPEGLIARFAKAGVTVYASSVYEGDQIELWNDDIGQHVKHNIDAFGVRGERIGAYACARTKAGTTYVEPMSMDDIERVKKVSKQRKQDGTMFGPWVDWPERMAEKSCLHRIAKRVPSLSIPDDEEFRDTPAGPGITVLPREEAPPRASDRPRGLQAVLDASPGPEPIATQPPSGQEIF